MLCFQKTSHATLQFYDRSEVPDSGCRDYRGEGTSRLQCLANALERAIASSINCSAPPMLDLTALNHSPRLRDCTKDEEFERLTEMKNEMKFEEECPNSCLNMEVAVSYSVSRTHST